MITNSKMDKFLYLLKRAYYEGREHQWEHDFPDVGMHFDTHFTDTKIFKEITNGYWDYYLNIEEESSASSTTSLSASGATYYTESNEDKPIIEILKRRKDGGHEKISLEEFNRIVNETKWFDEEDFKI